MRSVTGMRIAELSQVTASHPHVPHAAVEHLLWALHRVRPLAEAGDTAAAAARLRTDLVAYPGEVTDLALLGVTRLFDALDRGRHAFAGALGAQGLLAPERRPVTRYVIVGPLTDARRWARERGIGLRTILAVARTDDVFRLRGVSGAGVAIIRLAERRSDMAVETALTALIAAGAITLPPHWTPGTSAGEGGEPRLRLTALPGSGDSA